MRNEVRALECTPELRVHSKLWVDSKLWVHSKTVNLVGIHMKLGGGGGKGPNCQNVLYCLHSHRIDSKEQLEPVLQHHSNQNNILKLFVGCSGRISIGYLPYTRVIIYTHNAWGHVRYLAYTSVIQLWTNCCAVWHHRMVLDITEFAIFRFQLFF